MSADSFPGLADHPLSRYAAPVARTLLAAIFLFSGLSKAMNPSVASAMMAAKDVPLADALLVLTVVIEIAASLALVVGFRTRTAALILLVWMIPVTMIFHAFWAVDASQVMVQRSQFMKNLAIMGGLLMVALNGPGPFSLDRSGKGSS